MMKKLKDNFLAIALTCVIVLLFSVVLINQAKAEHFNLDNYARKCYNDNDAKEWKQAAESCKISAYGGDAKSQFNLYQMYAEGKGVKMDNKEAYIWLSLSIVYGHALDGLPKVKEIFKEELTPKELNEALIEIHNRFNEIEDNRMWLL